MPNRLRNASLAAKLGMLGAVLMCVALGSIALTVWVTWQLEGGAASVNEAGRLRMQTWRIAQAASHQEGADLGPLVTQFDASLELLRQGDPERPLFLPGDAATLAAFDAVRAEWTTLRERWLAEAPVPPERAAAKAGQLVARIDVFVDRIEARLARWTALLTLFQLSLMGLAIAAGIALIYAAHLFVFRPLARLQHGLAAVEAGNLGARVEMGTHDEFERVGEGFNRMAARLQGLYGGLERKVAEKTAKLAAERERLAVLYEASRFVAAAPTLESLGEGFVGRARRAGRADAVLLRWRRADEDHLVLLATEGVPPAMLEAERCLAPGQCLCGTSADARGARVIPILPLRDTVAPQGCREHGFDRVLTLPVRAQEQLVGEIDLLYRDGTAAVSGAELELLESLAHLLASGMESLRAAALEREAAVSEERGLIARELHDSIAQSLAFMKIQAQLLRAALKRPDPTQAAQVLGELDAGLRESMADVRELLLHFRTRASGDDIVPALKSTLQKFQHQTGITTQIEVQGHGVPLAPDVQVQLLHMVQEALSNVRKHAGAREVRLSVRQQPHWAIEVRDDGRGFDTGDAAQADETHVGLRIMRERGAGIGATVRLESRAGQGSCVRIELPGRLAVAA